MLFRRSLLCTAIYIALQSPVMAEEASPVLADDVEFNDQFLFNTGSNIDVSRYSKGNPVPPGTYKTQILLNGQRKLLGDFTFNDNGTPRATPCFTSKLLTQIGVKTAGWISSLLNVSILPNSSRSPHGIMISALRNCHSPCRRFTSSKTLTDTSILRYGRMVFRWQCFLMISTAGIRKTAVAALTRPMPD